MVVVIACCFENNASNLSSGIITLLAGLIIASKMLYQLLKVPQSLLNLMCFVDGSESFSLSSMTVCDINNTAHWIGVYKTNEEQNLIHFLGAYLMFIAAAMVFCTVSYYQIGKRYGNMPRTLTEKSGSQTMNLNVNICL